MSTSSKSMARAWLIGLVLVAATGCRRGGEDQAQLAREAKITPEQAQSAALATLPGAVQRTRLDRDNGAVVYEVTVAPQGTSTQTDVEVDAGSGTVLKTQPATGDSGEGDDD